MNIYLIFSFLFQFIFLIQKDELVNFVETQEKIFQKINSDSEESFTSSIEKTKLFSSKSHFVLKAKNFHSNKASYDLTLYIRIKLWKFDFETKQKCRRAQDSLLNSFPNFGDPIKRNINISYKITPSIFIFNENLY